MAQCESRIKMVADFETCKLRGMYGDSFGAIFFCSDPLARGIYLLPEENVFTFLDVAGCISPQMQA